MKAINSENAPAAVGPYSQAVQSTPGSSLLYCSGQLPLDPGNMKIVAGGAKEQTQQIFANIKAVLKEAGFELSSIIKSTVFLADMADFAEMNEIYSAEMGEHRPARSTIQVAALPMGDKGARVEIEVIAEIS